jgi:hypothetical protein
MLRSLKAGKASNVAVGSTLHSAQKFLEADPGCGVDPEVFTEADAQTLVSFATQNHLGRLAFCSVDRDQPLLAWPLLGQPLLGQPLLAQALFA